MQDSYTGEVTKKKCSNCGAVGNFDFECGCYIPDNMKLYVKEDFKDEMRRVSKLPFNRPPMPFYAKFFTWISKLLE